MNKYIISIIEKISQDLAKSRVEPHIVQKCDRSGNTYWRVYDPISGSHCSLNSEQEVRSWLDTRYYQHFIR
jgi:hypothetical protein